MCGCCHQPPTALGRPAAPASPVRNPPTAVSPSSIGVSSGSPSKSAAWEPSVSAPGAAAQEGAASPPRRQEGPRNPFSVYSEPSFHTLDKGLFRLDLFCHPGLGTRGREGGERGYNEHLLDERVGPRARNGDGGVWYRNGLLSHS